MAKKTFASRTFAALKSFLSGTWAGNGAPVNGPLRVTAAAARAPGPQVGVVNPPGCRLAVANAPGPRVAVAIPPGPRQGVANVPGSRVGVAG